MRLPPAEIGDAEQVESRLVADRGQIHRALGRRCTERGRDTQLDRAAASRDTSADPVATPLPSSLRRAVRPPSTRKNQIRLLAPDSRKRANRTAG